jgi:hypothetical protein
MHNFPPGWRFATTVDPASPNGLAPSAARRLVTRSGARSRGRFPSLKSQVAQCYESQLELAAFRLLELAPSVRVFTSQPAQLRLSTRPAVRYTPDLAVVLADGVQHIVEVKPARVLLNPSVLDRMREVARLYRELGQELRFLLDIDIIPTPQHAGVLRDAVHFGLPKREVPRGADPELEEEDCSQEPTERQAPSGYGAADLDAVRLECDRRLESALSRDFERTVSAARAAQWAGAHA